MRIKLKEGQSSQKDSAGKEEDIAMSSPSGSSSFISRFAKSRQVKKTKSTLPKTPTKRAEVVKKIDSIAINIQNFDRRGIDTYTTMHKKA